ncbi:ADP-ribosylglycohydrolase family protein [Nocardia cyriacigeorgica]|uniref:ADP-ribosylglycohydrolase family protein n=1 Tax=Nocardia cyriacigeorgica TaxID=135487 RepID=UPI00189366F6|nr:ADP-ribosylglycohydrolase family protein [Nocardia cyriacigeorgica]MBF6160893.1 ADP-ribosylglycohydrolase family protein [Nocardia cyriacigeorgica]MBF6201116.1 ADP-ribosylglycohydrolase family protein [Nocardia cyriacigeorgica]MBF6318777.1 ADP-ribosylglycohydrolase family protein [Nocardia cyriacigeorgica]MBF6344091.1 ADP-ribosylglycohydrolase family protein [Nocardia cyriacigeorgica]
MGAAMDAREAPAIAVSAALTTEPIGGTPQQLVERGLRSAVNRSGDCDAIGAMCGNLLARATATRGFPRRGPGRVKSRVPSAVSRGISP